MEEKTKQRFTGGIILVAVLAIFLPILFHNSRPVPSDAHKTTNPQVDVQLPLPAANNNNNLNNTATQNNNVVTLPIPAATTAQNNSQAIPTNPIQNNSQPSTITATQNDSQSSLTNSMPNTVPSIQQNTSANSAVTSTPQTISNPVPTTPQSNSNSDNEQNKNSNNPKPETIVTPRPASQTLVSEDLSRNPVSKAWIIQLASFSDIHNAGRLQKQLQNAGFPVHLRTNQTSRSKVTRVIIGPEADLQKLKHMQQQIKSMFHITGVIRKS